MYAQLDERVRYATRTGAREGRCGVRKINGACSILHVVYYKSDEALDHLLGFSWPAQPEP